MYFAMLGLFFASIAILMGMIPFSAWRSWRCWHRGRHLASWIWAVASIAFFLLMFGWPAVENIRLWRLQARMDQVQVVGVPDLRGKIVAVNTGWDGFDAGRDDCAPFELGAARVFALASVGNIYESRTEGLRINLSRPVDLTKALGPEMVLRERVSASGYPYQSCEVVASPEPAQIDYVILKDAPFEYLPETFQLWFAKAQAWGSPSVELYAGPVTDPTRFQPDPKDAEALLTGVAVSGRFVFPLLLGITSSETASWRNTPMSPELQKLCMLLHATCRVK